MNLSGERISFSSVGLVGVFALILGVVRSDFRSIDESFHVLISSLGNFAGLRGLTSGSKFDLGTSDENSEMPLLATLLPGEI